MWRAGGKGCPSTLGPGTGGAMWPWRVASQGWASKKRGQETGQQKGKSTSGLPLIPTSAVSRLGTGMRSPGRDRLVTSLDNRRIR